MDLEKVILNWGGKEVEPMEVYRDMFFLGENMIQRKGEMKEDGFPKSNPLVYYKSFKKEKVKNKGHYRIMLEDSFEETLKEAQEADFSIINGITYFGRKNIQDMANKMYAMIFDLDGVTESSLGNLFSQAFEAERLPIPNYIALSGHNVHLYYLFERPIPLYPNIKTQLKELKYALTQLMWNRYTSEIKTPQYQGINQGFRVIGGKTKLEGIRVRAFRIKGSPYNLDNLSSFVPEGSRVDESKIWRESKMTLQEAAKKYPDWYAKVLSGESTVKSHVKYSKKKKRTEETIGKEPGWNCKRDLYDWWLRQIKSGAVVGHRYFCVMCLAIYAVKSVVTFEELKKDAYSLIPLFTAMNTDDPFTKIDCDSALECFDTRYKTFPINDIIKLSGIQFEKNKRNYQKREWHLEDMRNKKNAMKRRGQDLKGPEGRPSVKNEVIAFIQENPNMRAVEIANELGLGKSTVYKYMSQLQVTRNQNLKDKVIEHLTNNPHLTVREVAKELGVSRETVYKHRRGINYEES